MSTATDVFSSVGTIVSVSAAAPATIDAAGFGALTYSIIGELAALPTFGAEAALATHVPLATGIVNKRRGSVNYGAVALPMASSASDTGAAILATTGDAAPGSDAGVAIKVLHQNGTIRYFTAQVMSFKTNVNDANSITMHEANLEIDSIIIKA